jgi:hypothetical protein
VALRSGLGWVGRSEDGFFDHRTGRTPAATLISALSQTSKAFVDTAKKGWPGGGLDLALQCSPTIRG